MWYSLLSMMPQDAQKMQRLVRMDFGDLPRRGAEKGIDQMDCTNIVLSKHRAFLDLSGSVE